MEKATIPSATDKQDEVQRLRDMIKNLEIENELLRSRSKKPLVEDDSKSSGDMPLVSSDLQLLDENDILKINSDDFSEEETWLYQSKKNVNQAIAGASSWNLLLWLRGNVDSNMDYEFQLMRRMLVSKIEDFEQGSRRNNIDTRTFTRPKKRLSRPGLQTMVDSPLLKTSRGLIMPYLSKTLTISEGIDDTSMPLNSTVSSPCLETPYLNANFQKLEESSSDTTFQQVENTRNIMFQKLEDTGLNSTFRKSEDLLMQNEEWPRSNMSFSKILSEPHLNTTTELRIAPPLSIFKGGSIPDALNSTYHKSGSTESNSLLNRPTDISAHGLANTVMQKMAELNSTFQVSNNVRSRNNPLSGLDTTFSVSENESDNHTPNKRAASCDSVGDDDYSSASDCSFSIANCQNNDALGDVQNRARLQEESLKITVSTPLSNHKREVPEDLPSPILHPSADGNHDYQSDHSDHSSVAKSSRSSQRSSPANSPFGSTNMLATVNGYYLPAKQQLGGSKLISRNARPATGTARVIQGQNETVAAQSRPASGLRPPAARAQNTAGSGLPRPGTNIPRPKSRIPAPRTRIPTVASQPAAAADWMDGCY